MTGRPLSAASRSACAAENEGEVERSHRVIVAGRAIMRLA
ncbi:hypothetical protein BSIN_1493 [Burkholderia singularis]|uniref:Uncharacterized protein n=1 Tax=Burkholderia singularis TaxID=1503053 RepID=A0A238GZ44_9BURK|nr:hypothetical protein BSIN_1493 [Burkholderia singularis]